MKILIYSKRLIESDYFLYKRVSLKCLSHINNDLINTFSIVNELCSCNPSVRGHEEAGCCLGLLRGREGTYPCFPGGLAFAFSLLPWWEQA